MKRNMTGKFSSILISVLFLCTMFIASSTGAKAYASEYVDVEMNMGFNIADVDVDSSGHVYAIDSDTGNIVRMDSDGTNRLVLCTVESAQRIAVDDVNRYIYITNGTGVVQRMNIDEIDGADVIDFVTFEKGVRSIAVDDSGRVYVGESGVGIVRIEQDGTGSTLIRSVPVNAGTVTNITVDDLNEYIYYSWSRQGLFALYRLNTDGSDVITVGTSGQGIIRDVYVDNNGYVYYTKIYGVYRIGSNLIYPGVTGLIAVDENGCMYVSEDQVIHKIMMMTVEQLMAEIRECIVKHIDNGNIADIGSSLISKYDNFFANFGLENNTAAFNQLDAFINEVSAQRGDKIAMDVADALIARAQTLRNIITGEGSIVERIVSLKELIVEHIDYENIEAKTAASLVSKLDNCSASLDKEDNTAAANQLNAFINEVSAQSGKKISGYIADRFIGEAQALLEMIEEPVDGEEAQTSEEVPVAAEESTTNEEPTPAEEATEANPPVSEETEVTEIPTTIEEPATVESSAVEEESYTSETTPAEEPQTSEATDIPEEAVEANPIVNEETELTEVPTTAEMITGLEETQP